MRTTGAVLRGGGGTATAQAAERRRGRGEAALADPLPAAGAPPLEPDERLLRRRRPRHPCLPALRGDLERLAEYSQFYLEAT